jgi:glycosyltransferase involved in cell wall biosynthesis
MNILELNFEKSWRGGERQTLYNMQGFRNAGITVELICRKGSPLETKALQEGFTVYSFDSVFGVIAFLLSKGRNYKTIHAQTSHILTYCVFTKPFHKASVMFTRRVNFAPKGFFTKQKYLRTDKLVAISESVKNIVSNFCGRTDVVVISDIVVKTILNKERAEKMIHELNINGKHIIGTTSALTYEKDPLTMIEAIKKLKEVRNDFIFLHFGGGDMMDLIKEKIKAYGLQEIYFLMGYTDNVEDIFSLLEVFVMSSIEEGLGSSVLDAFIYKVPVVSTNAGGLKDLVGAERGILCETKNASMIANGINTLLDDPERKQRIINKAYDYVIRNHSMEYVTDQYCVLIKE